MAAAAHATPSKCVTPCEWFSFKVRPIRADGTAAVADPTAPIMSAHAPPLRREKKTSLLAARLVVAAAGRWIENHAVDLLDRRYCRVTKRPQVRHEIRLRARRGVIPQAPPSPLLRGALRRASEGCARDIVSERLCILRPSGGSSL